MPLDPVLIRLKDSLAAIDAVATFIEGHAFDSFAEDIKTRWSVERAIEIVSEAARHIPAEMTVRHPEVPWNDIRAIGNRLRHEYYRIDDAITWHIATVSLPQLRAVVFELITTLEGKR